MKKIYTLIAVSVLIAGSANIAQAKKSTGDVFDDTGISSPERTYRPWVPSDLQKSNTMAEYYWRNDRPVYTWHPPQYQMYDKLANQPVQGNGDMFSGAPNPVRNPYSIYNNQNILPPKNR